MLITLEYHRIHTPEVEDLATFSLITDIMIDLNVYAIQNDHNSVIVENDREATAVLLYLAGRTDVNVVDCD